MTFCKGGFSAGLLPRFSFSTSTKQIERSDYSWQEWLGRNGVIGFFALPF